jgi:hypothetical protein
MNLQQLSSQHYPASHAQQNRQHPARAGLNRANPSHNRATRGQTATALTAKYYSAERLSLSFTSADGDSVAIQYESIEAMSATLSSKGQGRNEVVTMAREEFLSLSETVIRRFVDQVEGKKENGVDEGSLDGADGIEGLPEYWNAENTSQRIVEFAVSFHSLYEGEGGEYLSLIREAIEQGFSEAREMLGELSGPVGELIAETFDLTMQKLDAWGEEQGIITGEQAAEEVAA